MGYKSTRTLKRSEALMLYHELQAELYGVHASISNRELAEQLESMQDLLAERRGSTNFDNFRVVDDHSFSEDY